jgi:large subunit ribosomal protein L3
MTGIIGKKVGMSQIYLDNGKLVPVSLIEAGPCPVVQVKNQTRDGYTALQLGFGKQKKNNKPLLGHLKKAKRESVARLFEIRVEQADRYKVGDTIDVSQFNSGDKVVVTGWTKGRGFSGGVKRWGWTGGPTSHGSMAHRRIGSSGPGSSPGRIWKNKTMPGRYGNEQITIKNVEVMKVDKEKNLLYVKGAVPGAKSGYLVITKEG